MQFSRMAGGLFILSAIGRLPLLEAQEPPVRRMMEALRDSIAHGQLPPAPLTKPREPADFLRAGLFAMTAGEAAGDTKSVLTAVGYFYEVVVARPRWPYAWYGLGAAKLVLARMGAREVQSPHQAPGTGWLGGAAIAFREALRIEPTFAPAVAGLARVVLEDPDATSESDARRALVIATRGAPGAPEAALALTRLWLQQGSFVNAEIESDRFQRAGGDTGVAAWERARALFGQGRNSEAADWYWESVRRSGSPEVATLIRDDLALLASAEELSEFDSLAPPARESWLRSFWSRREMAAARPAGTRLPEHFRRVRYARTHYRIGGALTQYAFEQIFRNAPRGLDDRGVIYIRHGEPDDRATYVGGPGVFPNESWLYFRPEGNLVFHFVAMRTTGFRLVEDLRAIGGRPDTISAELASEIYESRAGLEPIYLRLASEFALEVSRARSGVHDPALVNPATLEHERQRTRELVHRGTTTDSDPLELTRAWDPIVQVFGVPSEEPDVGGVLVVLSLPAPEDSPPIPLGGSAVGYVLRLRVTAANDLGAVVLDADSLVRLRASQPLASGQSLTFVRHFLAPAGSQRVRVVIADSAGTRGAVRVVNAVPVTVPVRGEPVMGDILVGRSGSGLAWHPAGGIDFPLNPRNAWTTAEAIEIGFDLSGLSPDSEYNVRLAIADLGADPEEPPRASVEFRRQVSGERTFVVQTLGLRTLRPGRYLLTATVTVGDRVLRRERRITVVAPR